MSDAPEKDALTLAEQYHLDDLDKRIMQLKIQYPGLSDRKIGELVKCSRETVHARRHKPAFKAAYTEFNKSAAQRIAESVDKAARVFMSGLESKNERIKRETSKDILVHASVLKTKQDADAQPFEPLVIEMEAGREIRVERAPKQIKDVNGKP